MDESVCGPTNGSPLARSGTLAIEYEPPWSVALRIVDGSRDLPSWLKMRLESIAATAFLAWLGHCVRLRRIGSEGHTLGLRQKSGDLYKQPIHVVGIGQQNGLRIDGIGSITHTDANDLHTLRDTDITPNCVGRRGDTRRRVSWRGRGSGDRHRCWSGRGRAFWIVQQEVKGFCIWTACPCTWMGVSGSKSSTTILKTSDTPLL